MVPAAAPQPPAATALSVKCFTAAGRERAARSLADEFTCRRVYLQTRGAPLAQCYEVGGEVEEEVEVEVAAEEVEEVEEVEDVAEEEWEGGGWWSRGGTGVCGDGSEIREEQANTAMSAICHGGREGGG
jgi:hypothetical protein